MRSILWTLIDKAWPLSDGSNAHRRPRFVFQTGSRHGEDAFLTAEGSAVIRVDPWNVSLGAMEHALGHLIYAVTYRDRYRQYVRLREGIRDMEGIEDVDRAELETTAGSLAEFDLLRMQVQLTIPSTRYGEDRDDKFSDIMDLRLRGRYAVVSTWLGFVLPYTVNGEESPFEMGLKERLLKNNSSTDVERWIRLAARLANHVIQQGHLTADGLRHLLEEDRGDGHGNAGSRGPLNALFHRITAHLWVAQILSHAA